MKIVQNVRPPAAQQGATHTERIEEDKERENMGLHLLRAYITIIRQV